MKRLRLVAALAALLALVAACSSGSSGGGSKTSGGTSTVTISNESGGLWSCGFSPYNPDVNFQSIGFIYEPLLFINALNSTAAPTPWLASSYAFSNGSKTLTFTIRKGVKWSDGQPLTPADVVFTFQLMKQHPALDINALWAVLNGVKQVGSDQVQFSFKTAAVPYLFYIADQTGIVPEHIWSKISNPVNYTDKNPVGTGPFVMQKCTGQNVHYVKNNDYWQKGLPKVDAVNYPAFTSNDPANTYLATGQAQYGGQFIPNIQAFYGSKSPNHHYWFPPVTSVSIFINQTVAPLNDVAVRKALAYCVNRPRVSQIGEYGYEPPANQTGITVPTFASWLSPAMKAKDTYDYDPTKAQSILTAAGYHKGSDGIFVSPSGQKLAFSIINISDYSDWVASLQVVQQGIKACGMSLTVDNQADNDFDNNLFKGKFQLAYYDETGGPAPYYELRQWLYGPNSAPIGQPAGSNYERYHNPTVDRLINQYAETTSLATQHSIVDRLEQFMLDDVPVIPVTEQVDFYEYDTTSFTGWDDPSDPIALPAPFQVPDVEVVLLHLNPK
ncbi:MAG TPA: ABC transporter substrate-binding protein [Mycobacteriales bacterium]|nr:ABC transporter substrate-binding protein [Mycobacteriales bacterium]